MEFGFNTRSVTRDQCTSRLTPIAPNLPRSSPPTPPREQEVGWKNIVPKGVMIKLFLSEACATSFPISNPNKINVVAAIEKRRPATPLK